MATSLGIGLGLSFQRRRGVPITATGGVNYRVHVFEGLDDFVVTDVGDSQKVNGNGIKQINNGRRTHNHERTPI